MNVKEARTLLTQTSTNNATGIIGGPHSCVGYTLSGALTILERCDERTLRKEDWFGRPALLVRLPGFGEHVWYLNLDERKADPWD
jgi:hypothetical protein